jgi:hypothetical protein
MADPTFTEAEVRTRISLLTLATVEPTLTSDELDVLVAQSKRIDAQGLTVDDASWSPTWSLNGAIALGWELKAAKVALAFDVQTSKTKLTRSQMYTNCMAMADRWRRRVMDAIQIKSSLSSRVPTINNASDELWDIFWGNGGYWEMNFIDHGYTGIGGGQWLDD